MKHWLHCAEQHIIFILFVRQHTLIATLWFISFICLSPHCIEPKLGKKINPCFIYDFPASQASLSRIQPTQPPLASRFEVYYKGIELANGFHELQDAAEQRQRFENNRKNRKSMGLPDIALDEYLLAALSHGLPNCSGVALGIDRLCMLAIGCKTLANTLAFDINQV